MNESYVRNVVEAALLAAGRPLQIAELAQLFEESGSPGTAAIRDALQSLEAEYTGRGIEVKETGNGFRIQVRRDVASEISRLWPERPPRYSRALLETLALIAYRQPITRGEIEAVRGVAVNPNIIKTMLERGWVKVVGLRDVPGRPELLGTTREFLDYFGLRTLEDLPPLAQLKAMGDINLQLDLAKDSSEGSGGGSDGESGAGGNGADGEGNSGIGGKGEGGSGIAGSGESASGSDSEAGAGAEGDGGPPAQTSAVASLADDAGPALKAAAQDADELAASAVDDSEADAGFDDDAGEDDEHRAGDPQSSGELVAAPRDLDD
jgi:segregation and condensation protein B